MEKIFYNMYSHLLRPSLGLPGRAWFSSVFSCIVGRAGSEFLRLDDAVGMFTSLVSSSQLLDVLASFTMGIGFVNRDLEAPAENAETAVIPVMATPQSPPILLSEKKIMSVFLSLVFAYILS